MKKKVRILYPTAAVALGIDMSKGEVQSIDESVADQLLPLGFAELVKTETAAAEPSKARTRKKTTA
jgi:hypothetical protein